MPKAKTKQSRVVIVGGGFAGVKLARLLSEQPGWQITLISELPYFDYHAGLCRLATGGSALAGGLDLRVIFPEGGPVQVITDEITRADHAAKTVAGVSGAVYPYDKLVLAVGVRMERPIAANNRTLFGVRSQGAANAFKEHLHANLQSDTPESAYVIVGGGPTGVELAGDLISYLKKIRLAHGVTADFNLYLLEKSRRLLPGLPADMAANIAERLEEIGVVVRTGVSLDLPEVSRSGFAINIGGEEIVYSKTAIWVADVQTNSVFADNEFIVNENCRVKVNDRLMARPDVFVVGDSADTEYAGWAQTALYDAKHVARSLAAVAAGRVAPRYDPPRPAVGIPVGGAWVGSLDDGRCNYGRAGWLLRRQQDRELIADALPADLADRAWQLSIAQTESCEICRASMAEDGGYAPAI
jgi:NADH dehydrogenase